MLIEEADIVGDWQRPAFDLATQSVGVLDGDRLVAYAEVYKAPLGRRRGRPGLPRTRHRDGPVALDPSRRRPRRRHRSSASPCPATPPASGCSPPSATARCGPRGCSRCPPGGRSTPQPVPEGYAIREPRDEADLRATWTVNEDAFLEWSDRERTTFEEWAANVVAAAGLRAVAAAPHGRPRRPRSSAWPSSSCRAAAPTSTSSRCGATSAARGWPARCSSTPSRWPAHTVASGRSCRPTPAPARSVSMRRSACRSRRCGATGRSDVTPEPVAAQA